MKTKVKELRSLMFQVADMYGRSTAKGQKIVSYLSFLTRQGSFVLDKFMINNRSASNDKWLIVNDIIKCILYWFHQMRALKTGPKYDEAEVKFEYGRKQINAIFATGLNNLSVIGQPNKGYTLRKKI